MDNHTPLTDAVMLDHDPIVPLTRRERELTELARNLERSRAQLLEAAIAIEESFAVHNKDGSLKTIGHGIDADSPRGKLIAAITKMNEDAK